MSKKWFYKEITRTNGSLTFWSGRLLGKLRRKGDMFEQVVKGKVVATLKAEELVKVRMTKDGFTVRYVKPPRP